MEEIRELIRNNKFEEAESKLKPLLDSVDPKIVAEASYLIGYVYTSRRNLERNEHKGLRYLLNNIWSDYAVPNAFALYGRFEEDKNKAEGYLRKGLSCFPGNPLILKALLDIASDTQEVIDMVENCGATDFELLSSVIESLIHDKQWEKAEKTICLLKEAHNLSEQETAYLSLLQGYSKLFKQTPDYIGAIDLFRFAIEVDIDNVFGYSHYLGLIYAGIMVSDWVGAKIYFDRLPVSNTIFDLWEGPWYFITVDFQTEYKRIFETIIQACDNDEKRVRKAKCLYSLYRFNPYLDYAIKRFDGEDYQNLKEYCSGEYNKAVVTALFSMACDALDYREANRAYLQAIAHDDDLDRRGAYYSTITDEADDNTILEIVDDVTEFLGGTECFSWALFSKNVFEELVGRLHDSKHYDKVAELSDHFSVDTLTESEKAFHCAYAYAKRGSDRAYKIYSVIVDKEPNNSSALNNLSLLYEERNELGKAYECLQRATELAPNEINARNLQRVKQKIESQRKAERSDKQKRVRAMVKDVNLAYFESIGYDDAFIAMFDHISDATVRKLIIRDVQECVVAIAAQQNKTATILIGSILEAVLFASLNQVGVTSYTFTSGKQPKTTTVEKMVLAELLTVARERDMITENSFRLSHYIRDYRNVVHPAKELRENKDMSHENVKVMWHVFKQLVKELLK